MASPSELTLLSLGQPTMIEGIIDRGLREITVKTIGGRGSLSASSVRKKDISPKNVLRQAITKLSKDKTNLKFASNVKKKATFLGNVLKLATKIKFNKGLIDQKHALNAIKRAILAEIAPKTTPITKMV